MAGVLGSVTFEVERRRRRNLSFFDEQRRNSELLSGAIEDPAPSLEGESGSSPALPAPPSKSTFP